MRHRRLHLFVKMTRLRTQQQLCPHLVTRHLPDAHPRAAEQLGHVLHGVYDDADSAPYVRCGLRPKSNAGFEGDVHVTLPRHQSIRASFVMQSQGVPAVWTEREEFTLHVVEVAQAHGQPCRISSGGKAIRKLN